MPLKWPWKFLLQGSLSNNEGINMKVTFFAVLLGVTLITGCGTTLGTTSVNVPITAETTHVVSHAVADMIAPVMPEPLRVEGNVSETTPSGEIDWSGNTVRATGTGVLDPQNPNIAQARLMAERAAVVVAQRNLLETVQGVRVDSETRVENFMTDYDVIYTRVEGVVKNAKQLGPSVYDEAAGTVEVELEMEIHSSQGLSGALSAALDGSYESAAPISGQTRDFMEQYSAIVFDGSAAGLTPSMYPKIYDANGNLLLDTASYAQYLGSAGETAMQFISDVDQILSQPAFAQSPLIVNVRQVTGQFGSDIVLGQQESESLGWLKAGLPFLMSAGKFLLNVVL